jgi:proline iminopeptidase
MVWLDQRGSGRSASDPKKDYSLARVVQDLEEVRSGLQVPKWVVVSHSFGGIIAAEYARKHPDRVSGLVLVNSILHLPASMESTARHGYDLLPAGKPPMDATAPLPQRFGMVMAMLNQTGTMKQFSFADPATDGRVKAAMKGLESNMDFTRTVFSSPAITTYVGDMAAASTALTMPVLTISGTEDHMVGVDHYKSFRFPSQRVVLVPGKHYAMIEQTDEVAKALASFVPSVAK